MHARSSLSPGGHGFPSLKTRLPPPSPLAHHRLQPQQVHAAATQASQESQDGEDVKDAEQGFEHSLKHVHVGGLLATLQFADTALHVPVEWNVTPELMKNSSMEVPSAVELMRTLEDVRVINSEVAKLTIECEARKMGASTEAFLQPQELASQYEKLTSVIDHLRDILDKKGAFLARLQQPFSGDSLAVEPHMQRILASLVLQLCKDIALAPQYQQSIQFIKSVATQHSQLSKTLQSVQAFLATFHRYSETVAHLRHNMRRLAELQQLEH